MRILTPDEGAPARQFPSGENNSDLYLKKTENDPVVCESGLYLELGGILATF
jgi:hypothetical protein